MGDGGWRKVEVKGAVVDTRHVAGSTWLVLLWFEAEGVDVDTSGGHVGVVLVWLNQVKVASITLRETVVAVKLNLGGEHRVHAAVEERSASGVNKAIPAGDTERLAVAAPRKVASGWAASTEHVLEEAWASAFVAKGVDLGDTATDVVPSAAVGVAGFDVAWASEGTTVEFLGSLVFVVETLLTEAVVRGVSIVFVDAAGLVEVDVSLVALASTIATALAVVWEVLVLAFASATRASAAGGRSEGVVVAASVFAAFAWATGHIAHPLVVGGVVVGVEVDSLVGKAEVEVLGVDHASSEWVVGGAAEVRHIDGIREVEVLWATVWESGDEVRVGVGLDNPHKLLDGVVEVELDFVGGGVDGLGTSELKLLNKVFVADLGETTALIRVEVDVVDVERSRAEARSLVGVAGIRGGPVALTGIVELKVNFNLVVLESNKRKRKTWVAAEPELKGHVNSELWDAARSLAVVDSLWGLLGLNGATRHNLREAWDVANHISVSYLKTGLLGELVPDVEPLTVLAVDTLSANLDLNVVDEGMANPVDPAELVARAVKLDTWKSCLKVDTVD